MANEPSSLPDALRRHPALVTLGALLTQGYETYAYDFRKIDAAITPAEIFTVNIADTELAAKVSGFLQFFAEHEFFRIERDPKTGEEIGRETVFSGQEIFAKIREAQLQRPEILRALSGQFKAAGYGPESEAIGALAEGKLEILAGPAAPGNSATSQLVQFGEAAQKATAGIVLFPETIRRAQFKTSGGGYAPVTLDQVLTHQLAVIAYGNDKYALEIENALAAALRGHTRAPLAPGILVEPVGYSAPIPTLFDKAPGLHAKQRGGRTLG